MAYPIPRRPLLDRRDLAITTELPLALRAESSRGRYVSSGRAAIFWALDLLGVREGDNVLVPTYHCPTLVAPVVMRGARPVFFPLESSGLPDLARVGATVTDRIKAMIVPQFFGLPLDLSAVRKWCDEHEIGLIEDCAHTLYGRAGSRLAGEWGDFATASLAKFIPVRELGRLFSVHREIPRLPLHGCSAREQFRAALDPWQLAVEHGRTSVASEIIARLIRQARSSRALTEPSDRETPAGYDSAEQMMVECDVGRFASAPALASRALARFADFPAIAARRRQTFQILIDIFVRWPIGTPLTKSLSDDSAPYAIPLLVDEPDTIYPAMRSLGFPVYRWDRLWPGTPSICGDTGLSWRYNLLQIPIHQSYSDDDLCRISDFCRRLLGGNKATGT